MLIVLTDIRSTKELGKWKTTICVRHPLGGRCPLVVENFQWKTSFGGRRHSVEDDLWWRTTFSRRRPSVEDNLWLNMTFGGRQTSVEEVGRKRPLVEDDQCGRQPLMEDDL